MLELQKNQLEAKDQRGLTLAMLAAGSGTVSIMKDVLERIANAKARVCSSFLYVVSSVCL